MAQRMAGHRQHGKGIAAVAAAMMVTAAVASAADCPGGLLQGRPYEVPRAFFESDGVPVARDLSGIACRRDPAICVVINDESRWAQAATLDGSRLTPHGGIVPGSPGAGGIRLFRRGQEGPATDRIFGSPPQTLACGENRGIGEMDGEAVAFDGTHFYVVGSHGCGRRQARFRTSAFLIARFRVDGAGAASDLQMSYRLSEVFRGAPALARHFGGSIDGNRWGLNIEGMTAVRERLLIGLRAPLLDGQDHVPGTELDTNADAIVVGVAAGDLFRAGGSPATPQVSRLRLLGGGIRDLAYAGDGRVIVLSGPALGGAEPPFKLWEMRVGTDGSMASRPALRELACLAPVDATGVGRDRKPSNPEAVLVLESESQARSRRVLVLFDGPQNGAPREYTVELSAP